VSILSTEQFNERLARLAMLGVATGVNLQSGQELIVNAPLEAAALVRHISRAAYRRGARLVTCLYDDPDMIRARFDLGTDDALEYAAPWMSRGIAQALDSGAARLYIAGPYPDLLAGIAPERVLRAHSAAALAISEESRYTSESRINWSVLPFVTASWARMVFPDLAPDVASEQLWEAVFEVARVHCPDPVAAWQRHIASLNCRRQLLQTRRFDALHFRDGRTDLRIGLVRDHRWVGGATTAANGIESVCNIPNEELFTCPHRSRAEGRVFLSKPLVLAGELIDDVCIDFHDGAAVSIRAGKGQSVLDALVGSEDASRRLGEVALVAHSSPVSARGILFYNALLDENAATHFAFGQAYGACLSPGVAPEETGANESRIHIDCMFGTAAMDVDGISPDGAVEPIMRAGEFVL